jgi:prolyl-tRNA editing enzyme YbaK/EbsC (Cys-tRNA(Pro) deacylase)
MPDIKEFSETTRTSAEAAAAIGCTVAQIAKSVVFRAVGMNRAVLVIASGANRVDEKLVAAALGDRIAKADAAFVRDKTGFAIGGVAPVGHTEKPVTLIDEDLLGHAEILGRCRHAQLGLLRLTPGAVLARCGTMSGGRGPPRAKLDHRWPFLGA